MPPVPLYFHKQGSIHPCHLLHYACHAAAAAAAPVVVAADVAAAKIHLSCCIPTVVCSVDGCASRCVVRSLACSTSSCSHYTP